MLSRGTITMSRPAGCCLRLNSSRARRFARFRTTADPSLRVAATPSLVVVVLLATTKTVMKRPARRRPLPYALSKSGLCRTRRDFSSPSGFSAMPGGRFLTFVGYCEALSALRSSALQDNATILRRHSDPESVRLGSTTGVGLVSTNPLRHGFPLLLPG